jgi:hypothetical protein
MENIFQKGFCWFAYLAEKMCNDRVARSLVPEICSQILRNLPLLPHWHEKSINKLSKITNFRKRKV